MAWKPVNYGDDRNPGVWDTGNGSLRNQERIAA
jgi:hypothetical protein